MRRLKFLASSEGRQEQALLLLEGTHLLQEVLRTTHRPKEIVATNFWLERHGDLVQALPAETLIHLVTPSVLEASLTTVSPDGVASLLPLDSLPQAANQAKFVLALDRLRILATLAPCCEQPWRQRWRRFGLRLGRIRSAQKC